LLELGTGSKIFVGRLNFAIYDNKHFLNIFERNRGIYWVFRPPTHEHLRIKEVPRNSAGVETFFDKK
jgi:hypothetical protein